MRDPPSEAFDGIAKYIFGIDINSSKAKWIIKHIRDVFIDFRNKYNDNVFKLVEEYKYTKYFSYFSMCFFFFTGLIMVLILIKFYL